MIFSNSGCSKWSIRDCPNANSLADGMCHFIPKLSMSPGLAQSYNHRDSSTIVWTWPQSQLLMLHSINILCHINYFLIQNPCTLNCTDMSNECDSVIRKKCILFNEYVPYINGEIFSHWSVKRVSYTSVVQWIVKS